MMSFKWWQDGVFYQIYPRSFQDSNDDGIGDLQGIINRLDYLVELGVDAIWISPIFPSPMADFGYDVADYTDIEPMFGDLETFDRLLAEAHQRNLKIVLDYVPNHSSDEHAWFKASRSSKDNPKRDWYIWRDAKPDGSPPNNWVSFFGGSAWAWDDTTQQYYLHLFDPKQPDLNWRNPDVVEAMLDVLRFWLDRGVDGFRMDVVTFIYKHPDMPDNPVAENAGPFGEGGMGAVATQEHKYNINQPEAHDMLKQFRQIFDSYEGDRVTIGETWFLDPVELVKWYGDDDELHMPFNFAIMKSGWDASKIKQFLTRYYAVLPAGAQPNFVLGSHDEPRLISRVGVRNHLSAAMLLLTLYGTPTIYYGDEIGMANGHIPPEYIQDPQALNSGEPDQGRDPCRTPMQWTSQPGAGFTAQGVKTWLPINGDHKYKNVENQKRSPHSTLNFYKILLMMRRNKPALHGRNIDFIEGLPWAVVGFRRWDADEQLLILINMGNQPHVLDLSEYGSAGELLLSTYFDWAETVDLESVALRANEGVMMRYG